MSSFRLATLAKTDLAEIRSYIARDKPGAADQQITRFFENFQMLSKHPELGQRHPEFGCGDLRVFSAGSYVIFYRPVENGVEIARVVSGYRDLNVLF